MVFKTVLEQPALSPSSNTPDSTRQFIIETEIGLKRLRELRENKMCVRSASRSAATALKEISAKTI